MSKNNNRIVKYLEYLRGINSKDNPLIFVTDDLVYYVSNSR